VIRALAICLALAAPASSQDDAPDLANAKSAPAPKTQSADEMRPDLERALAYLLESQRESGDWGTPTPETVHDLGFHPETYYAYKFAAHGVACIALADCGETPERRAALDLAAEHLVTSRISTRGSDWDQDKVWSLLYGFAACVHLAQDERFAEEPWKTKLETRGKRFYEGLVKYQSLAGGWAYYDSAPFSGPTWDTSFCTALVLPPLIEARELGWGIADRVIERATLYLERCAMPNGAYAYSLSPVASLESVEHINLIQGSLGRTQVCNWALHRAGVKRITPDVLREGLESLFTYHGFLDHVRTRPVPHEGHYRNAGYFYFFAHYYAAKVIGLLPQAERESWHARLRPHLTKTLWKNGATSDYLDATNEITSSTSYLILALSSGATLP
jgi:hypothetical protein